MFTTSHSATSENRLEGPNKRKTIIPLQKLHANDLEFQDEASSLWIFLYLLQNYL